MQAIGNGLRGDAGGESAAQFGAGPVRGGTVERSQVESVELCTSLLGGVAIRARQQLAVSTRSSSQSRTIEGGQIRELLPGERGRQGGADVVGDGGALRAEAGFRGFHDLKLALARERATFAAELTEEVGTSDPRTATRDRGERSERARREGAR